MTQNALVRHQDGFYEITPKPSPEALAAFYRDKYYGARSAIRAISAAEIRLCSSSSSV